MLTCPHCSSPLKREDAHSRWLLTPKACRACGDQYFEGGSTVAMAAVGAGAGLAGLAGGVASLDAYAPWVPLGIALGISVLAVLYTRYCQPLKVSELRRKLLEGILVGPLAAILMLKLFSVLT